MKGSGSSVIAAYASRGLNVHRAAAINSYAGQSVLDVGCGNGAYVFAFKDKLDIRGVDYSDFEAWHSAPELFAKGDAHELSYETGRFDTVLAFEALEHLSDPGKALKEFHRVCRKNIVITVPNCALTAGMRESRVIFYHWIDPTHINFWDSDSLQALVERCGFSIRHVEFINNISLGPLFVEAFRVPHFARKFLSRVVSAILVRKYPMTILLVAEKA